MIPVGRLPVGIFSHLPDASCKDTGMDESWSELFWEHRPVETRPADRPDLSPLLAALYRRCAEAWPRVVLPAADFVRHLARHAPAGDAAAIESLHCSDLYLACACAHGVDAAVQAFDQIVLRRVPEFLSGMVSSPEFSDEVRQELRTGLLVHSDRGRAKIATYSGRGSLVSWARIIAVREAVRLKQRGNQVRELDEDVWSIALTGDADPELDYLKRRYKPAFEQVLGEVVGGLSGRQRTLLRLRYGGRLSTSKLAAMYKVNQSTISRWLQECHQVLRRQIEVLLRQRIGLNTSEFESLSRLVRSQLHVSLAKLLPGDPSEDPFSA